VQSVLTGTDGILERIGDTVYDPPEHDQVAATDPLRGAQSPHSRPPEELAENLAEMGQKETPEHVPFDLNKVADGLVITYDERCSFAPGDATVAPALARSLGELGRTLEHYPYLIAIEGHTDDRFRPDARFPSAEALSLARAAAAAEALLAESNVRPEHVQIAGLGASRPRATEGDARAREKNRRVEVRVLSLSRLAQNRLDLEKERERAEER
jgi:flagellar motor protein MotB